MVKARYKKLALALVLVASIVFSMVLAIFPTTAFAASETGYEQSNVLDDLKSSTVNGVPFDVRDYPFDETKDVQIINFVEYAYSYRANMQDYYGLYIYLYNPSGMNISTESKSNRIQIATRYDSEGNPTDYTKFDLKFCNKSEGASYKNLFYKFKVVDKKVNGTYFVDRVNSHERRYDVSGVEIKKHGANNAVDYFVGGTYTFTGYSKGCGPDMAAESTLACSVKYLETVELEVKHTFYRTLTSSKGAGYQNQLDTVYFAVPKRFFDIYGKLQRIKAEWYEYKTKDIVVTSNQDFYDQVSQYLGVPTNPVNESVVGGMPEYNSDIYYSLGENAGDWGGGFNAAIWGYNLGTGYFHPYCQTLYYLFKANDITAYDPYADITENGGVASNVLYDYIMNYDRTHVNGYLPIKEGTISADLFEADIDDYRKLDTEFGKIQQGYSYYDFDADVDLQKLSSWSEGNPSFWDNWMAWGLWDAIFGTMPQEESRTISPIYTLKESDLQGSNADIADRLLINANDVDELKEYYRDAKTVFGKDDEEKVVVLFRFATSDYFASEVDIMELGKGFLWSDKHTSGQAYRAFESVFLDFDIIQLTFNRDGVYKVIPVVSSPIDIVNAITPPVEFGENDWWKTILAILLLILLVVILFPILPYIIKFIVWLICLPFRAIAALIRACKKRKNKDKEE